MAEMLIVYRELKKLGIECLPVKSIRGNAQYFLPLNPTQARALAASNLFKVVEQRGSDKYMGVHFNRQASNNKYQ